MSTDAIATIELTDAPAGYVSPWRWGEIALRRDYLLFDFLAGGRSGDPRDAVAPRHIAQGDREDGVTRLSAADLEVVAAAYRERTSKENRDLQAIIAAMQALNEGLDRRTRLALRFF